MIVEGDRDRLRQVVDNLAVNAVNHTPEGASIEIRVPDDGAWVVLRVHDDGPGIDPVRRAPDLRAVLPFRPVSLPVVRRCRPGTGHRGGHRGGPPRDGHRTAGTRCHLRGPDPEAPRRASPSSRRRRGRRRGSRHRGHRHGSPGLRRYKHRSHRSRRRRRRQDRGSLRCRTGGGIVVRAQRGLTTPVLRRSARAIDPPGPPGPSGPAGRDPSTVPPLPSAPSPVWRPTAGG